MILKHPMESFTLHSICIELLLEMHHIMLVMQEKNHLRYINSKSKRYGKIVSQ